MNKRKLLPIFLILVFLVSVSAQDLDTTKVETTENISVDMKPAIVFFYSSTCPHCEEVEKFLDKQNTSDFEIEKFEASQHPEKFSAYIENHSVPTRYAGSVPTVFIGEDSAVGSKNSINLIKEKTGLDQSQTIENNTEPAKEKTANDDGGSLSEIGFLGLIGLAATDSINPCALAVLLILIGSIMSNNLEDRLRALKSGTAFTAGIFLSYLSMGVLLVFGIKELQKATSIGFESVYIFFGSLAVLVGLLNLKDGISHGFGGFVMEVPYSWRPKMKSYLKKVTGPVGAFTTAVIVSLFLLPCTSGPYFIAGGILSRTSWSISIPLLILYNVVFIAPMLLILGGLYYGVTEIEEIKEWREENIEKLHLIAGLILIGLGLFLLIS